ncbi:MAG: hypothetical protein WCP20_12990 [Desulfuromonadales bacterium]
MNKSEASTSSLKELTIQKGRQLAFVTVNEGQSKAIAESVIAANKLPYEALDTPESIGSISRDRLLEHKRSNYISNATIVSAAGNEFAAKQPYSTIRLDAFAGNPCALALYERLGFRRAGSVSFRKGMFWCFESQVVQ